MRGLRFASERMSLMKPAWDSGRLTPVQDVGRIEKLPRFAFIQTANAVFTRAKIAGETPRCLHVVFVKKSSHDKEKIVRMMETIEKDKLLTLRVYID